MCRVFLLQLLAASAIRDLILLTFQIASFGDSRFAKGQTKRMKELRLIRLVLV
ncbi:MAG: hypothetical protein QM534_19315 [Sediminibacterium sp.]|nr:hypothetical protein [Sediminibacterium sp.]